MRLVFAAFTLLFLAGCATRAGTTQLVESAVIGKKIEDAIALYGLPDRDAVIDGNHYYAWARGRSVSMPTVSTTTGTVDGKPVSVTTQSTAGSPLMLHCQLTLLVRDGVVVRAMLEGNDCMAFRP